MGKAYRITTPISQAFFGLACDGEYLEFSVRGRCTKEEKFGFTNNPMREVDVVSILSSGNGVEIALNIGVNFYKKTSILSLSDIGIKLSEVMSTHTGSIHTGVRESNVNGVNFTQYLYIFDYVSEEQRSNLIGGIQKWF